MNSILYDLQAADSHWQELKLEAEHERLVKAALKLRRDQAPRSRLARYLDTLTRRGHDGASPDPRKN
ncbi:MAG TPA: hypothetical protein PKD53_15905 [Chloroflexaceae bacterium]|nr:hypothetical protein [Chloroflexaceae bacterium]